MQQPPQLQHHHFCRWLLPEGHSPEEARAAAFPGLSSSEAAAALDSMSPRQLRVRISVLWAARVVATTRERTPLPLT
jgi:hypothetical protein